jgi:hypothetical protein
MYTLYIRGRVGAALHSFSQPSCFVCGVDKPRGGVQVSGQILPSERARPRPCEGRRGRVGIARPWQEARQRPATDRSVRVAAGRKAAQVAAAPEYPSSRYGRGPACRTVAPQRLPAGRRQRLAAGRPAAARGACRMVRCPDGALRNAQAAGSTCTAPDVQDLGRCWTGSEEHRRKPVYLKAAVDHDRPTEPLYSGISSWKRLDSIP